MSYSDYMCIRVALGKLRFSVEANYGIRIWKKEERTHFCSTNFLENCWWQAQWIMWFTAFFLFYRAKKLMGTGLHCLIWDSIWSFRGWDKRKKMCFRGTPDLFLSTLYKHRKWPFLAYKCQTSLSQVNELKCFLCHCFPGLWDQKHGGPDGGMANRETPLLPLSSSRDGRSRRGGGRLHIFSETHTTPSRCFSPPLCFRPDWNSSCSQLCKSLWLLLFVLIYCTGRYRQSPPSA